MNVSLLPPFCLLSCKAFLCCNLFCVVYIITNIIKDTVCGYLFGPVLRFRGEIVEGVVSLSDPTEQHSHYA